MLRNILFLSLLIHIADVVSLQNDLNTSSTRHKDLVAFNTGEGTSPAEETTKTQIGKHNDSQPTTQPVTQKPMTRPVIQERSHIASTTSTASAMTTVQHIILTTCHENFGQCLHKETIKNCSTTSALLHGICGNLHNSSMLCCIENQEIQKSWEQHDDGCKNVYGKCQLDTMKCDGAVGLESCGGPTSRQCCSPGKDEMEKWTLNDTNCQQEMGKCQINTIECEGPVQQNMCGGPTARQCCLPSNVEKTEWQHHDEKCHDKWGICHASKQECEDGTYESGLCGGPEMRQCCTPSTDTISGWAAKETCSYAFGTCQHDIFPCNGTKRNDKELCQGPPHRICCLPSANTTKSWSSHDDECSSKQGRCQHESMKCSGEYEVNVPCGGPENRRCCVQVVIDDPPTNNLTKRVLLAGCGTLLFIMVALLIITMGKRCAFTSHSRMRDLNWYGSNEAAEVVNLTSCEDNGTNYA